MTMEYRTTMQPAGEQPVAPTDGDDWMLAGACEVFATHNVYMYWQRPKPYETKVCRKCRAIAFNDDGNCVGCGTPQEN